MTARGWESANFDPSIFPDFGLCLAKLRAITIGIIASLIKHHKVFRYENKRDLLTRIEQEKLRPKKG